LSSITSLCTSLVDRSRIPKNVLKADGFWGRPEV
jgi:hypothetical protein